MRFLSPSESPTSNCKRSDHMHASCNARVRDELTSYFLVFLTPSGLPGQLDGSSERPRAVCVGTVAGVCWKCV